MDTRSFLGAQCNVCSSFIPEVNCGRPTVPQLLDDGSRRKHRGSLERPGLPRMPEAARDFGIQPEYRLVCRTRRGSLCLDGGFGALLARIHRARVGFADRVQLSGAQYRGTARAHRAG